MQKAYARRTWENYPSEKTAVNEENLNHIEAGLDAVDDNVVTLDATKLDKVSAADMVKSIVLDEDTGIFTVTKFNGAVYTIDTKLEKLAVNYRYDAESQCLHIILDDGTEQAVDLSSLISQFEFHDSDTIYFTVSADGKVQAAIKKGSVTGEMLEPDYLAGMTIQADRAEQKSAEAQEAAARAETSESRAAESGAAAGAYAKQAGESAAGALESKKAAEDSAVSAAGSAEKAAQSEQKASDSAEYAANVSRAAEDVVKDIEKRLEDGDFTGPAGPAGQNGVTTPIAGFFTMTVDSEGNLWVYSNSEETVPAFEYDSETGNLYMVMEVE